MEVFVPEGGATIKIQSGFAENKCEIKTAWTIFK
jgi:hypothetical protein